MAGPRLLPEVPTAGRRFPVLGHLPWLMFDEHAFLERTRRELGPMFWVNHWIGDWMLIATGEQGLELLRGRSVSCKHDTPNFAYALDHTLLVTDGDEHRRLRGAMRRPFSHKGLRAHAAGELIAEVVDARLSQWVQARELPLLSETSELAIDIIFRLIGVPSTELSQWRSRFRTYVFGGLPSPGNLPGTPRWWALRARDWMDSRIDALAQAAREHGDHDTLLGAMAHGTDEDGRGLSDEELKANLRILGLAGHETIAATIAWSLLHLGSDRARWDRLVAEASAADQPPLTPSDLKRFPFAEAVFRECARLYPPISVLRRTVVGSCSVHGVVIPDGVTVGVPLHTIGADPERYDDAKSFVPERWLGRRVGPAEAFQFGAGAHFCLGYHLALLEVVSFLVRAARALNAAALRPHVEGLPSPAYFPMVRPPSRVKLRLQAID